MIGRLRPAWPVAVAAVLALAPAACSTATGSAQPVPELPDSDPARGARLIEQYGCGACHTVPRVRGADGLVGPPLTRFGRRSYVAGELTNSGANLQRWIRDPQSVETGTAMPNLGVSAVDARDIAAYLLTLD